MKTILAILVMAVSVVTSGAATFTLKNLSNLRLDGLASGDLESTLANYPEDRAKIEAAVVAYLGRLATDVDASVAQAKKDKKEIPENVAGDLNRDVVRAEASGVMMPKQIKDSALAAKAP